MAARGHNDNKVGTGAFFTRRLPEMGAMMSITQLSLPIILSALFKFIASGLIHNLLNWHRSDYLQLAREDDVRAAIRSSAPVPGQYLLPNVGDMKEMLSAGGRRKFVDGPVGIIILRPNGLPSFSAPLRQWFLFNLSISIIAGYVASLTLRHGATSSAIMQVVGVISFIAYGSGGVLQGIWMGKPWRSVGRELVDAALYALICVATFVWLWP